MGTSYFTTKIINIKKFHITTFLPPSLTRVLLRGTLPLIMAQQKRGYKFALSKIDSLLKVIKAIITIGIPDWDKILNEHPPRYPTKDHTAKSLKRKFQELARTIIPTGVVHAYVGQILLKPYISRVFWLTDYELFHSTFD
jgi:hypothetical protein